MLFPQAVPEIPVDNVDAAVDYYVKALNFHLDWGDDSGGIAGISQGDCRLFLTNASFRKAYGTSGPATVWLNLLTRDEWMNFTADGATQARRFSPSRKTSPGVCASSEPRISTAINYGCSTIFPPMPGMIA